MDLQKVACERKNIFAALMEAWKVCSLGSNRNHVFFTAEHLLGWRYCEVCAAQLLLTPGFRPMFVSECALTKNIFVFALYLNC